MIYFLPFSCDCAILFFDSLFVISVRPQYKVFYCMAKCLLSGWGFCSFSALVCQQGSEIYRWLRVQWHLGKSCCPTGNVNTRLFIFSLCILLIQHSKIILRPHIRFSVILKKPISHLSGGLCHTLHGYILLNENIILTWFILKWQIIYRCHMLLLLHHWPQIG